VGGRKRGKTEPRLLSGAGGGEGKESVRGNGLAWIDRQRISLWRLFSEEKGEEGGVIRTLEKGKKKEWNSVAWPMLTGTLVTVSGGGKKGSASVEYTGEGKRKEH